MESFNWGGVRSEVKRQSSAQCCCGWYGGTILGGTVWLGRWSLLEIIRANVLYGVHTFWVSLIMLETFKKTTNFNAFLD